MDNWYPYRLFIKQFVYLFVNFGSYCFIPASTTLIQKFQDLVIFPVSNVFGSAGTKVSVVEVIGVAVVTRPTQHEGLEAWFLVTVSQVCCPVFCLQVDLNPDRI